MSKTTTGLNHRPKDSAIAKSGPGIPDDSGAPIEVTADDEERIRHLPIDVAQTFSHRPEANN